MRGNYKPTDEEISKVQLVRQVALEWGAKDIRKSAHMSPDYTTFMDQPTLQKIYSWYDGGSMIGAVILGMCAIQHAAAFRQDGRDSEAFIKFVNDFFGSPYNGAELYSLRVALIKQYSTRCYVFDQKGKEIVYLITNGRKDLHLGRSGEVIILNIQEFAKNVYEALDRFFQSVIEGTQQKEVVLRIVTHYERHRLK